MLGGVKTRYATNLSLLSESGTVVGVSGQNDRGLSFVLRVPAGTDLMASPTLDVATLADGLVYIECSGAISPSRCALSEPLAMQLVARAGTVTIADAGKTITATFDLSDVTVTGGDEGQSAHGCFQVPDARAGAAGAAGAATN